MLKFKRTTSSSSSFNTDQTTANKVIINNLDDDHVFILDGHKEKNTLNKNFNANMNSPALYHRSISLNGTLPQKDHGHALKKFLIEMKSENFDDIKLATYRAAAKLYFVQKSTNLHLVDIYNIIEAFRENGLNTLDHAAELDEARLECIVASIYYALVKRLPLNYNFDVEKCIVILTQWIMHAYDGSGIGRIRVLSVKTALSMLCDGRLIDKLRYVFTQISGSNGLLVIPKFDNYLRDLLLLPGAVGEELNFSYSEDVLESFFKPAGPLNRQQTKLDDFLDTFINEKVTGLLLWLDMLSKLSKASSVEHKIQCKGCGKKAFKGLRYKCSQCANYQLCQDCFWRERISETHKKDHPVKEYSTWGKSERGSSVRRKFLCSPGKSSNYPKLPNYPKEPELNKTLDMSNIVPPLPSEPNTPNTTLTRRPRILSGSASQHSTLSRDSTNTSFTSYGNKQDVEHQLISMYAQRLAECSLNRQGKNGSVLSNYSDSSVDQKEMLSSLEEKNRTLLLEIRQLKAEHAETIQNEQQISCDKNLLTELSVLRQRKDELEMHMSALQETRRELMVQLEGLMKLLKKNQLNNPRSTNSSNGDEKTSNGPKISTGASSTLMRGVKGDVKEAFDNSSNVKEKPNGQDLRADLMLAVDDVTNAMRTVVQEISTQGKSKPKTYIEDINQNEVPIITTYQGIE